jgi:hypothetical protein
MFELERLSSDALTVRWAPVLLIAPTLPSADYFCH